MARTGLVKKYYVDLNGLYFCRPVVEYVVTGYLDFSALEVLVRQSVVERASTRGRRATRTPEDNLYLLQTEFWLLEQEDFDLA